MNTISCPHCDHLNLDSDVYCANCGRPLKEQTIEIESTQKNTAQVGAVERNSIVACCALALLLFFFPLVTIHVPVAGDQDVSGYDVFSKLTEFREKLQTPDLTSAAQNTNPTSSTMPDAPLSLRLAWFMPFAIVIAFISAVVALVAAFKNLKVARTAATVGACCAAVAIVHVTVMNSDIHSWLTESMKSSQTQLKGNPYAGLAENLSTLIVNAFQVKPGWGLYALLVLLGIAAALGFTRVLSRLRLAPMSNS